MVTDAKWMGRRIVTTAVAIGLSCSTAVTRGRQDRPSRRRSHRDGARPPPTNGGRPARYSRTADYQSQGELRHQSRCSRRQPHRRRCTPLSGPRRTRPCFTPASWHVDSAVEAVPRLTPLDLPASPDLDGRRASVPKRLSTAAAWWSPMRNGRL